MAKKKRGRKGKREAAKSAAPKKQLTAKEKRQLPPKQAGIFKHIIKMYETKQYKKGLKNADAILKKFPNHGETLAMKGLTLNCMGQKDDSAEGKKQGAELKKQAHELVKRGLKEDMESHVCWHVYGLLFRSEQKYPQAINAYNNALKREPKNLQILKDLSLMQIQTRDLDGFKKTRNTLLQIKPNQKNNWIGFAISRHLNDDHKGALEVLKSYRGTRDDKEPTYEISEIILYENLIIEEIDTLENALAHLDKNKGLVKSRMEWVVARCSLLARLGRFEEALRGYRALVDINPENYAFHRGLQCCLLKQRPALLAKDLGNHRKHGAIGTELPICTQKLSTEQLQLLEDTYTDLTKRFPRARAPRFIPLLFSRGDDFRARATVDIRRALHKGMPSYINELKAAYLQDRQTGDGGKQAIVEDILEKMESSLRSSCAFSSADAAAADFVEEGPDVLLHCWLLQAQHLDLRGAYEAAVDTIDEAIAHTPTLVDLYMCKARILKHAGDLLGAVEVLDHGRSLDLADRYVNSKCTKYMLRANQVDRAASTIALFLKSDNGAPPRTLYDMQCMWYEIEAGQAHQRQGDMARALKQFKAVEAHFDVIHADQFDFHTYCLRKMTLRAYVRLMRFEDQLQAHRFFASAARAAVECYLQLSTPAAMAARAAKAIATGGADVDISKMTASQKKRWKKEERQRKKKAAAAAAKAKAEAAKEAKENKGGKKGKKDEDPDGQKLLASVKQPLEDAAKVVRTMQKYCPRALATNLVAFDVAIARKKYLLAVQALRRALAGAPVSSADVGEATRRAGRFLVAWSSAEKDAHPVVKAVVEAECKELLGTLSATEYATRCVGLAKTHAELVAAAEFVGDAKVSGKALIEALTKGSVLTASATVLSCSRAQTLMESVAAERADEHKLAVRALLPRATQWTAKTDAGSVCPPIPPTTA